MISIPTVHHRKATVDGLDIFYREAGPVGAPAIVLLHGFPTSSNMFRRLIPALADRWHVIAPDLPQRGPGGRGGPPHQGRSPADEPGRPRRREGRANRLHGNRGRRGERRHSGGTILGTGGDEAIHVILDMMANGATATRLRETMHIHPTVSELIPTIAGELRTVT